MDARITSRLAELTGTDLQSAHADDHSILYLDRDPIRWSSRHSHGFGWDRDGLRRQCKVDSLESAARAHGGGLVIAGRRKRLLHSSASGWNPLYHLRVGRATYFSTRIDALTAIGEHPLTVDWEAWAAIFTFGHPLGVRTPFAEIHRLSPFATVDAAGRVKEIRGGWPLARIQPSLSLRDGLDGVLESMQATLEPLREHPLLAALSGGWDSRLILCMLTAGEHSGVRTFTVNSDNGRENQERLAAGVASALELDHEVVHGSNGGYWGDLTERYRRSEYQRPSNAWLVTLSRRLERERGVVTDGGGFEALMGAGDKFVNAGLLAAKGGRATARGLAQNLAQDEIGRGLAPPLRRAAHASAQRQFLAEVDWLRGHPSQALLMRQWTRQVRGESLAVSTALGCELAAVPPFAATEVGEALLAIAPEAKLDGALYRALFDAIAPETGALPSTRELAPGPRTIPRRRLSAEALREYERVLRDSPLREVFAPEIEGAIAEDRVADLVARMRPHWRTVALVNFTLWHERYRERLAPVDPWQMAEL